MRLSLQSKVPNKAMQSDSAPCHALCVPHKGAPGCYAVDGGVSSKGISIVIIRQYKESDLDSVLDSWEMATRLAHEFMTDDFIAQERKNVEEMYLPNTDTWVAEIGNEVKGFIALMGNEVGAIFLQPHCHGKGIGKALMDKAQELHGDLEVEVFKKNTIGRDFYSKYGFEPLEEKLHEPTGQQVLRLKFTANKSSKGTP
jgi:putative acetyltransferase